ASTVPAAPEHSGPGPLELAPLLESTTAVSEPEPDSELVDGSFPVSLPDVGHVLPSARHAGGGGELTQPRWSSTPTHVLHQGRPGYVVWQVASPWASLQWDANWGPAMPSSPQPEKARDKENH